MKLFKTTTRRTSYRTQPRRVGNVYTLKAKTRLKRWAKRGTKRLWRNARTRIRRRWKQRQRQRATRNRQVARTAERFRQRNAKVHAKVAGQQARASRLDGAMSSCRRCNNEIQYNGSRERWEHTGKGSAECFQRGKR